MTTRIAPALVLALLLAACGTVTSEIFTEVGGEVSPSPAVSPSNSPAAEATFPSGPPPEGCIRPPPDVTTLIEQTDPLACYGGAKLTFDAHLTSPGTFSCPGELQPTWFDCFHLAALNPLPGTSGQPDFLLVARSQGESLYAVIHPDIEHLRGPALDTLVHVTGHYDDPAAQDCRITSWPDANPPSPEEIVHQCRSTFVITAMELLQP